MKALEPLSWLYGAGVRLRNHLYDSREPNKLPVPVVSVGNLTVGGSGKTPLVAWIAKELLGQGFPVAVLSRGYGRRGDESFLLVSDGKEVLVDARRGGDEPVELARRVPGLVVAVGRDRYHVGTELLSSVGSHVMLLDDGFQHRLLGRDIDLVCFDCSEPRSNLALLPAGRLREPLTNVSRAHAVVLTQWTEDAELPDFGDTAVIRTQPAVESFTRIDAEGETLAPGAFDAEPVSLLVGIARPERVRAGLAADVVHEVRRRDHYAWREEELPEILQTAKTKGVKAVLTTGKDAVKLSLPPRSPVPVYRIDSATRVLDVEALRGLLAFPPL